VIAGDRGGVRRATRHPREGGRPAGSPDGGGGYMTVGLLNSENYRPKRANCTGPHLYLI